MLTLEQIIGYLISFKYSILLPIATIEGPIVSIISGFLVAGHYLNLWITYIILIAGDIIGDTVYYLIGRWGREGFIKKWGSIFGLTVKRVEAMEKLFSDHPKKILFFGKTQAFGSVILAAAGMVKMPYSRFIWVNFIAIIIKSAVLVLVGYYVGAYYATIDRDLKYFGIASLVVVVILVLGFWFWNRSDDEAIEKNEIKL